MNAASYRLIALPSADAAAIRSAVSRFNQTAPDMVSPGTIGCGTINTGAVSVVVADASPGYPCRHCLCDADIGDEVILGSYDPFGVGLHETDSSYRSPSPIYVHAARCRPAEATADLPVSLTSRLLSVRAFDRRAQMIDAVVSDGARLDELATELLANPIVERLHIHNAAPGCWAVTIVRSCLF